MKLFQKLKQANKDRTPKVLITILPLSCLGGVSNYYRVVKRYLADVKEIRFYEHGGGRSGIGILAAMITEPIQFLSALVRNNCKLVHLNPSLHSHDVVRNGAYLLLAKLMGKKVIVFWRGWNNSIESLIHKRFKTIFSAVFNRADLTLVLATEFKKKLESLGIDHKIMITSTIVDTSLASEPSPPGDSHKQLMFMSRLVKEKGPLETIDAFRLLKDDHPDLRLSVAGDGPEKTMLEKKYGHLEGLCFHGYLNETDKFDLMARSNLFIFPTRYGEGMPNCVLEAMAAGLPVVTRAVGGIRDFFLPGRHGLLVDNGDPREVADAVNTLLKDENLRKSISDFNRSYAMSHFSATIVSEYLIDIYRAVCYQTLDEMPDKWFMAH
ncbi:MAG: glycosyltransferase family 4 protein [Thermodesulfobacteriota bacterium]|nr:glycosyltransferase family 4 protein [Thermodesulfobacteriota bacterium]